MKFSDWKKVYIGAMILLVAGAFNSALGMYWDIKEAKSAIKKSKDIDAKQDREIDAIKNQMNDIHWYLIKRNNIKVPKDK